MLITHQQPTVEIADTLFGVTMGGDGVSQIVSRRLGDDIAGGGPTGRAPPAEGDPGRPRVSEAGDDRARWAELFEIAVAAGGGRAGDAPARAVLAIQGEPDQARDRRSRRSLRACSRPG